MKKSVIITIGIIYVLAIVIVGFIGMRMKVYNPHVYVESIVCETPGFVPNDENTELDDSFNGYIMKLYQPNLKVEIRCKIYPENAKEKTLKYIWDLSATNYKLIENPDGTATLEFYGRGSADIIIKSTDTKGIAIKIRVYAL